MPGRLPRLIRSLRGRTPHELRTRVSQLLASRGERMGLGRVLDLTDSSLERALAAGIARDPAALHSAFRSPSRPRFFAGPSSAPGTAAAVAARAPEHVAATIAHADRILSGRFDLLGHSALDYGSPPDWQRDPVAGLSAPLIHWSRVPYLDPTVVGDHKVVWELNRQQYLVALAQAWAHTGNDRYASAAASHIAGWLDRNPPSKVGINWASALEVAFRSMSWCWALHMLRPGNAIGPELHARMLGMLHVHGRHLETYLSTYFSPNTHLTGEALGLVYLGTLLPELRHAARWRDMGVAILEEQLPIHVRPDGTYFEQASQYHRYTTEIYLHLLLLAEGNGIALSRDVRPAVERMFCFLLNLARPDGTIPLLGDDDGGRLVQLDDRLPADVRALLATGAVVFGRADLAHAAGGDLAGMGWLLGAAGLERFESIVPSAPRGLSRSFPHGGFHVLRDGWEAGSTWAVVDCGPHGAMNCGHAHADALALELYAGGRPLLVDSGTFSYPGPERNMFRATAAHNAVTVDGAGSSEPTTPFQWGRIASCRTRRWIATPRFTAFAGTHDGFEGLTPPVAYRRDLLLLHGGYLVVRDTLEGDGEHEAAVHWQLAPGLAARIVPGGASADLLDEQGRALLRMAVAGSPAAGALEERPSWVSPTYGRKEPAVELLYRHQGAGRREIVTCLLPLRGGSVPPSMDAVERLAGGLGLMLRFSDGVEDWLLFGSAGVLQRWGEVVSDAAWTWIRRSGDGTVRDWLAADLSHLEVPEVTHLECATRLQWAGPIESQTGRHRTLSSAEFEPAE